MREPISRYRSKQQLSRKHGSMSRERILVITEGKESEPNYLEAVRIENGLPKENVKILPCTTGTSPLQVVEEAYSLAVDGSSRRGVEKNSFDKVFAVFDKDDHASYEKAMSKARHYAKSYTNFFAIYSDPCFELWLLLHFEDIRASIDRNLVYEKLKRYLPDYEKGGSGYYKRTRSNIGMAFKRMSYLKTRIDKREPDVPFTCFGDLVLTIQRIKEPNFLQDYSMICSNPSSSGNAP